MTEPAQWKTAPFRGFGRFALIAYVPVVLLVMALVVVERAKGIPIGELTRDAAKVDGVAPYAGFVSNLGALIWCVAAVVTLMAAVLYRRARGWDGWTVLLLFAGAFSTLLLVDDLFLLHDEILPVYANIPQKAVLLGYVLLAGAFVALFYRQIRVTAFAPLALAAVFFAASIVVDEALGTSDFEITLLGDTLLARNLFEDGFKLLGLVSWCGYLIVLSWQLIPAPAALREPVPSLDDSRLSPEFTVVPPLPGHEAPVAQRVADGSAGADRPRLARSEPFDPEDGGKRYAGHRDDQPGHLLF